MPPGAMTGEDRCGVADLVADALRTIRDRPARSFSPKRRVLRRVLNMGSAALERSLDSLGDVDLDFDMNASADPIGRLFENEIGRAAANMVGNESHALDIIQTLSVDLMLEALRTGLAGRFKLEDDMRPLFVPSRQGLPPTLLILDPEREGSGTDRITDSIPVYAPMLARPEEETGSGGSREQRVRRMLLQSAERVRMALHIGQPEVVVARKPRMERLCVPAALHRIQTESERSTAGIYCRAPDGTVGVTACFHGTGPEGTKVTIDGHEALVTRANAVQDIVFIPLPEQVTAKPTPEVKGVMRDRTPSQYLGALFEGATSGRRETSIESHDAGLLRDRPSIQLKVQTGPDTDKGDSGSALIDVDGNVLGFAFEKSAFGERPQITDWIWAANALRALELEPVT